MAVGQFVTKQTWLLDEVEIRGMVSASGANAGDDVGARDDFDIIPDEGYRHLVALIPGGNGVMHCETYPLPRDHVNRHQYWPLPQKDPAACFEVRDPVTGVCRPLKAGDHVRVVGRWTIDHHPETCVTRARGLLRVGCVWPELHPFQWDDITLVAPPPPGGEEVATLSLAAPIHEEVYLGGGKWLANELAGVSSKIFVTDDGSNYHSTVTATLHVSAPPLPSGWTADASLVSVVETVAKNGTGAGVDSVRTITGGTDGIDVTATVAAPLTVQLGGGLSVADVDGPSRGTQVFQARYGVSWRPRLAAAPVTVKLPAGMGDVPFDVPVENIGPDPVTISSAAINAGDPAVFSVSSSTPLQVPAHGRVTLQGRFAPPASGHYLAELVVQSNDPAGDPLLIAVNGSTADTSGRLRVRVQPQAIRLGVSTQVTIIAEDSGSATLVNGTANIDNYNVKGQLRSFQAALNQPFTATFYQEKEFDPELRRWIFGEKPSGVVNVPGYDQDPDAPIPFRFT